MDLILTGIVNGQTQNWPLTGDMIGVGRSSRHAVHLPDATVSKDHAEIVRTTSGWSVRDGGSRNGTRVNGVDVVEAAPLRVGDTIEFGQVSLRVVSDAPEAKTQFSDSAGLGSSLKIQAQRLLDRVEPRTTSREMGKLVHVLAEAGRQLVLPRPLRETCEEILRFVDEAVPSSRLIMLLREDQAAEPVQIAARTRGVSAREPLVLSKTIMDTVLNECTSVITRDASVDPRFAAQMSIVSQGIHSAMAVPLFDNERVLGLLYADSNVLTVSYGEEQLEIFTLLGNMAAVKITNARLIEADQMRVRLAQELSTATRIQRTLLPAAPVIAGYQCDVRLETCYEVGGDLYDFHQRPDGKLVFVVGDVSGKGMGAALLMSSVLSSLRVLYDLCLDPTELAMRLNAVIYRSTDAGHFVTLFVGCLDPVTGHVAFVNAGHNAPMVVTAGGTRLLEATGVPIAILPEFPYTAGETTLEAGALLAVFTDGIVEAKRGDEFYDDARLEHCLRQALAAKEVAEIGGAVVAEVDSFLAGEDRTDDVTLVLLRREG